MGLLHRVQQLRYSRAQDIVKNANDTFSAAISADGFDQEGMAQAAKLYKRAQWYNPNDRGVEHGLASLEHIAGLSLERAEASIGNRDPFSAYSSYQVVTAISQTLGLKYEQLRSVGQDIAKMTISAAQYASGLHKLSEYRNVVDNISRMLGINPASFENYGALVKSVKANKGFLRLDL